MLVMMGAMQPEWFCRYRLVKFLFSVALAFFVVRLIGLFLALLLGLRLTRLFLAYGLRLTRLFLACSDVHSSFVVTYGALLRHILLRLLAIYRAHNLTEAILGHERPQPEAQGKLVILHLFPNETLSPPFLLSRERRVCFPSFEIREKFLKKKK